MENIKVGDYAKHTKDGYIGKIINFNDVFVNLDTGKTCFRQYIKTAENIIDLIEVGDYVNGEKVYSVMDYDYKEDEYKKRIVTKERANLGIDHLGIRYYLYKEDIKSIVTKEAFAQMEYKVGE